MSSDNIVLSAEKRKITGKKVSSIREDGFVPAVVYEKGKDSINIHVPYLPMKKATSTAGLGQPVEVELEGKKILTMIKNISVDPVKNTLMHVEFHAVDANRPVEAEIPVHIEGDVPAEQTGNFIVKPNDTVTVKAIPANLPEAFSVSAEKLQNPGDHLTVADLTVPAEVEMLSEPELVLATVEEPRAVEEPEETEEVDAADVPSDHGGDDESSDSNADSDKAKED